MGPKKDDKKKAPVVAGSGAPVITITEEELAEAKTLPELNDFVFTNLYAFRMCRNQKRLQAQINKLYSFYNPEDPNYSEEKANKYKTIEMNQLLAQAQANGSLSAEDAAEFSKVDEEKRLQVLA